MFSNPSDNILTDLLRKAKRIAVVGLSPNGERASNRVAKYLQGQGYEIIPINPAYPEILGEKSLPDLKSIVGAIDIVDVFRSPETTVPIAHDAVEIGAVVIWFQEGVINEEAAEVASEGGLTVIMDRCIYKEHRRLIGA